jgi:uncharacterized protein
MTEGCNGAWNSISRRSVLRGCLATAAKAVAAQIIQRASGEEFTGGRPETSQRRFTSAAVESAIAEVKKHIADPKLAAMFERCLPNTLDTTVSPGMHDNKPDTFVITGDIDAMWLRDSSAQVWPYLRFAKQDDELAKLLEGVVRRHARMVLIDPYANAFTRYESDKPLPWAVNDKTEMKPGVAERKWEIDSLCYVIRLAYGYWRATGDTNPFDTQWNAAAWKIVETFHEQQRLTDKGLYSFMRRAEAPTDTLPLHGYGNPARSVGMIYSMFRPSDDACIFPLFVPANLFAVRALELLAEIAVKVVGDAKLAAECDELRNKVRGAIGQYGTVEHPEHGRIWAYEVDGFGNTLMMDDANAPGLLSLPYLESCDASDAMYQRSRRFALSGSNPYFFRGTAADGIGGPHIGLGQIWPMSIMLCALTSNDDREIRQCLRWLRDTTAGTGFMHESFDKNDPRKFTRAWFAWANTLFGELILKLAEERPVILREAL